MMKTQPHEPGSPDTTAQMRRRALVLIAVLIVSACVHTSPGTSTIAGSTSPSTSPEDVRLTEDLNGRRLLPADNWWNQDITDAPVDPQSDAYIDFIGRTRELHADLGPSPYGIPYIGVSRSQPRVAVTFGAGASESDDGFAGQKGYPIPGDARTLPNYIEGGVPGGGTSGDRHMLIVDRDRWVLFELYATHWTGQRWEAGSGAVFDLSTNHRRPEEWTSADAAGLAILPGLVRYDEAVKGPIQHAFRVTLRATNGYVWPASHRAGDTAGALPMGARLRLKASKDLSGFPDFVQNILRPMQTYGLIVADNGSDMYVTGTMDARWDNELVSPAFQSLTASDFEVVQLGWR